MRGTTCRPALWALISSLDSHRVAFSQSLTAALGTSLLALAHPSTVLAVLSAQRDAAAQALRHLGQLQRIGAPGATALAASLAISNRDAFLSDAVLSARISAEDPPGAIAVDLFPYGTCMTQLVRHLDELDPASGEYTASSPSPDTLCELRDAQFAESLALGAVVRACPSASSAADFASALAREDRGCAGAVAWVARLYVPGPPEAADHLGQMSSHPDAALAAAVISGSSVAMSRSVLSANDKVFPHGLA